MTKKDEWDFFNRHIVVGIQEVFCQFSAHHAMSHRLLCDNLVNSEDFEQSLVQLILDYLTPYGTNRRNSSR